MAAEKRITREKIIDAAYSLVRKHGMSALNARTLARALDCSTRPIYLSFGGMEELKCEVAKRVTETYKNYLKNEVDRHIYPEYKAYGMGYIRFAREEKQLFSYLFMRNRIGENGVVDGDDLNDIYGALSLATGLTGSIAERFHAECWVFVHGIATMLATSYLELDDSTVSGLVTDMFMGLKARFNIDNN